MSVTGASVGGATQRVVRRPHPNRFNQHGFSTHGFNHAVMKLGIVLLLWARRRAQREHERSLTGVDSLPAAERQRLWVAQHRAIREREREWALREQRLLR